MSELHSNSNSRNIPQTRGTLTEKVQSLSAVPSAFFECLQRGYILNSN